MLQIANWVGQRFNCGSVRRFVGLFFHYNGVGNSRIGLKYFTGAMRRIQVAWKEHRFSTLRMCLRKENHSLGLTTINV